LLNGKTGVVKTAILKVFLFASLQFNHEIIVFLIGAVDIKHRASVDNIQAQLFKVSVFKVNNLIVNIQQVIEEANQKMFIFLRSKDMLKPKISEWINVFMLYHHAHRWLSSILMLYLDLPRLTFF
jgi:hypothetical protein